MHFFHSILGFMVILVPLVLFHELGHFIFAKLFGVKVEVFSIGFGPKLYGRFFGETEFRISAFFLGGYVKLLGEESQQELSLKEKLRALPSQAAWKRALIFFGGPLFNFILAFFIFAFILWRGESQISNHIGRVVKGSYAEKVGFCSGDQVLRVGETPVQTFVHFVEIISQHPDQKLEVGILRQQATKQIAFQVQAQKGYNAYGEWSEVGVVNGLFPFPRSTQVGISNPQSLGGLLGLKTGDQIIRLHHTSVSTWEELESVYSQIPQKLPFKIQWKQSSTQTIFESEFIKEKSDLSLMGIHSSELFVQKVLKDSPAEKTGIQRGDRIVQVENQNVHSFYELQKLIQGGKEDAPLLLTWERNGKMYAQQLTPKVEISKMRQPQKIIGIIPDLEVTQPHLVIQKIRNPFKLFYRAHAQVFQLIAKNLISLKKLLFGEISIRNLGGPIMIGKLAGESLNRGWDAILRSMAIFSISLGVLNILPVPVLDGGHLLLLGIEVLRRKPLSTRQIEIIQGLGFIIVMILTGIAFHNDILQLLNL